MTNFRAYISIVVFFILVFPQWIYSQERDVIDDNAQLKRIDSILLSNPAKAHKEAKLLEKKANLAGDHLLQAKALRSLGQVFYTLDRAEEAAFAYMECAQTMINHNILDSLLIAQCLQAASYNYSSLGLLELTKDLSFRALKFLDPTKDYADRVEVYSMLGDVFMDQGNYEQALIYYDSTYQIDVYLKDTSFISADLTLLGRINAKLGRKKESMHLLNEAFNILNHEKHPNELSVAYNALGLAYADLNDFQNASKNILKALEISKQIKDTTLIINRMVNLCALYTSFEKYDSGKSFCDQSAKLIENNFDPVRHTIVYHNLGKICHAEKKYKEGQKNLKNALSIANKGNMLPVIKDIYKTMASQYIENENPKKAFMYLEKHQEISDSIFRLNAHVEANALKFKYESVKSEVEIRSLKLRNEIKERDLKSLESRQRVTISFGVLFVILGLLSFFLYSQKQKNELAIREIEIENQLSKISSLQLDIARALDQKPKSESPLGYHDINLLISDDLTQREYQILELVLDGCSNQEIAKRVFLSVNTIKFHLKKIYNKLDVSNRIEVMQLLLKK